ncbi:MAG: hypothetical protein LBR82_01045 [Desulfovibrio sp.]|jgi:ERCC4-type nuclease|nr:hypothetical protein [Desulfovibrio sp.]
MKIVVDSREQRPFTFAHERYGDVEVAPGTLQTGDYSLVGLADKISVERKGLDDLVGCLCKERERFEKELQRAVGLDAFCVVIEASWGELASGRFKSKMNAHSACQSVTSFMVRYKIPFVFAGSRQGAEYITWSILHQYLEGTTKRLKSIIKAHGVDDAA